MKKIIKKVSSKNILFTGTGRRKSAIARVTLKPGSGSVNIKSWKLPSEHARLYILSPLTLTQNDKKFDVEITLTGGGVSSRLDAIRLGIARALIKIDIELKTVLRKYGYLTRDYREKERKKPGLKRARRAPQWAKR